MRSATIAISSVPMPEGVEALYKHDYNLLRFKKARGAAEEVDEGAEAEESGDDASAESAE